MKIEMKNVRATAIGPQLESAIDSLAAVGTIKDDLERIKGSLKEGLEKGVTMRFEAGSLVINPSTDFNGVVDVTLDINDSYNDFICTNLMSRAIEIVPLINAISLKKEDLVASYGRFAKRCKPMLIEIHDKTIHLKNNHDRFQMVDELKNISTNETGGYKATLIETTVAITPKNIVSSDIVTIKLGSMDIHALECSDFVTEHTFILGIERFKRLCAYMREKYNVNIVVNGSTVIPDVIPRRDLVNILITATSRDI